MGTVTINTVDYEIYGTLAEAQQYLAVKFEAEVWAAASVEDQSKYLVLATRYFNRIRWKGDITDSATPQPLAWPRDNTGVTGHANGTTPDEIHNGFWEYVAQLAEDPSITNNPTTGSNVQRAKGGEAEVWFFRSTLETASRYPLDVLDFIRDYLDGGDGIISYDSGTGANPFVSVFDSSPDRTGGVY